MRICFTISMGAIVDIDCRRVTFSIMESGVAE